MPFILSGTLVRWFVGTRNTKRSSFLKGETAMDLWLLQVLLVDDAIGVAAQENRQTDFNLVRST